MQFLSATAICSNGSHILQIKKTEAKAGVKLFTSQKKPNEVSILRNLAPPLMAALVAFSPFWYTTPVSIGQNIEMQRGATLFRQTCIGCHDGGGNIIQPGATLSLTDLQKVIYGTGHAFDINGVDTEDKLYQITYFGKGRMPGFGKACTPRGQCTFGPRLEEEDIKVLAEFVKLQAQQGWPSIASMEEEQK